MKLESKDIIVIVVILVIAICAGLLSAYQYIDGVKKDSKNEITTEQLINTQQQLILTNNKISKAQEKAITLSEELKNSQQESNKKSDDLILAQNKINNLQSEIIDQVIGRGYPILKVMNAIGDNFHIYLQCSSDYPIYQVYFKIIDSEKLLKCHSEIKDKIVEINSSCYNSSMIFDPNGSMDLNGKVMHFIGYNLPKKNYYLMTEFVCKNIRTVQYSIIKFENQILTQKYRIYESLKPNSEIGDLLEDNDLKTPNQFYSENFFEAKTIIVDASK